MLQYSEITPKTFIVLDGQPHEVLSAQTSKKGRGKASNQTKLRNMVTGAVKDKTFHQSDAVQEADIEKRAIVYLFTHPQKGEHLFCEKENPQNRFPLPESVVGGTLKFAKEGSEVVALIFRADGEERIVGIELPVKVGLRVVEAPPNVRGNTAQGGVKTVQIETGASVVVPMFIEEGDVIRVNTQTGEYSERVSKS